MSAGDSYTVLLRSDGKVAIGGSNALGHYNLAALQKRGPFKQVSAGGAHTLLLSGTGDVVTLGSNEDGQCSLPNPRSVNKDLRYVQVSAGHKHSVALRSDGKVVYAGMDHSDGSAEGKIELTPVDPSLSTQNESATSETFDDECGYDGEYLEIPVLPLARFCNDFLVSGQGPLLPLLATLQNPARLSNAFDVNVKPDGDATAEPRCVQVSAGRSHTALLGSDGKVYAFGKNESGQCTLPTDAGHMQISAGGSHTVLLRRNGEAKAIGSNDYQQCDIPRDSSAYVKVSAGSYHTVLLHSDGHVDAVGCNDDGQCEIPPLEADLTYLQASAGGNHTVLLRSDGQAFIVGAEGEISIPAVSKYQTWYDWVKTKPVLPDGVEYVSDMGQAPVLNFEDHDEESRAS